MVERTRALDWSDTPLGPTAGWPDRLKAVVDLMLSSPLVSSVAVGPDRLLLYNDAAARLYGTRHPHALGRPLGKTFPDAFQAAADLYDQAFAGNSVQVHGQPLSVGTSGGGEMFDAVLAPVRMADGSVVAAHMVGLEIGGRVRAETALRESEERQAFLLGLSDALRPLDDPEVIRLAAAQALGRHLHANRVAYAENVDDEIFEVTRNYVDGAAEVVGRYRYADYGSNIIAQLQTGQPRVQPDIANDEELRDAEKRWLAQAAVGASLDVPLLKGGRLVAFLGVNYPAAHDFRPAEIELVTEVAERTWAAIERARIEAALRESEERLKSVLTGIGEAFYALDHNWRFLFASRYALELWDKRARDVLGRPFLEAFPHAAASEAFMAHRRVMATGASEHLEVISPVLRRWIEVDIISSHGGGLSVAFRDIDERKRREAQAAMLDALSQDLARLSEPDAIMQAAGVRIGQHLNLSGCNFCDVDDVLGDVTVHHGWTVDRVPTLQGSYQLREFLTDDYANASRNGKTIVVPDTARDEHTDREAYAKLEIRAFATIPFLSGGRWTAYLTAMNDAPRDWRDDELALLGEVSERVFGRVQKARAESALRESEERFNQFGEASQDVLWIRAAETLQWEYLTPAFETIYGLNREAALSGDNMMGWLNLILPEDRQRAEASLGRVREGEWVTFEYRIRRPVDGQVRWLRNTDFPIRGLSGKVVRIGGIGHDVTDLKRTQGALAAAESRQRVLLEGMPQLVWRAVDGGAWTWASPQWLAYSGQSEGDSLGHGWIAAIHPDDRGAALSRWQEADRTGAFESEGRVRNAREDRYRWFQSRATPIRDEAGTVIEWLGTSTDVDDLRAYQERQSVLVAELQHRTRNLIAVVRSVFGQTIRASKTLESFETQFSERLAALARVQGLLSQADQNRITIGALLRMELDALGAQAMADRVTLSGPEVPLRNSVVQTLALALHELATNARKYGALATDHGTLDATWRVHTDSLGKRHLDLTWTEDGVTTLQDQESLRSTSGGYGRELIERALPYTLGAKTAFELGATGVRCRIDLPLDKRPR